ncbi:MAG: NBR1-Ig-like domain-containing protein [Anaerolineales bacterium]
MYKKIISLLFISILLTSCISISVDSNSQENSQEAFVTATLIPTKEVFVPATITATPAETITPTVAITIPANCTNTAVLLRDVTIQDNTQMRAGEKFTKTWEFQNTGTCPWVNYTLKFAAGDQMGAPASSPINTTTAGAKTEVSVDLTAPTVNGSYTGYFTLNDASGKDIPIGIEKTFWVKIVVGASSNSTNTSPTQSSSTGSGSVTNANCKYSQNAGYVNQITSMINAERAKAGLPALTINSLLTSSAQAHAADMACNNNISHTGSDGSSAYSRIIATGYSASYSEEIIYGGGGPEAAMSWWMGDQVHHDAILSSKSTEIGVGYAYYSNGSYGDYITVDFGSP